MRTAAVILAVLALVGLAGCDLVGTPTVVFGSLVLPWGTLVPEGTTFQVMLYAEGTPMDIATSFETAPRAVVVDGQFPVTGGLYDTVNYQVAEVPAGTYTAFAWVDVDGDGALDPWTDFFGWHGAAASFDTQPAANVVVAEAGLADVDFMLSQYSAQ